jgi:electron transfer flavoprotein beta subunit
MKIVVLMKQVPDTWGDRSLDLTTGWVDRTSDAQVIDEINERALEVALSHKDSDKATEVVVLTMGPADVTDSLRKALAMGCDSAVHVLDDTLAGSDAAATAALLAAALRELNADLIIAGNESTDGRGGLVPAMIAEHLGLPHLGMLGSIEVSASSVSGMRLVEEGTQSVRATLPAVISVNESTPDARFPSFKGIMGAKKKPVAQRSVADLAVSLPTAATVVVSTTVRPARSAGIKIVDNGTAGDQIAAFLAENRLI